MAYQLTCFPEPDMCPDICTDIGAFVKSPTSPAAALDEIKEAKENAEKQAKEAAEEAKQQMEAASLPAETMPSQQARAGPPKEEYLPNLRPGPDGEIDWTPLAEMTGTRPPVSKYSLSRYSLKEWQNRNDQALNAAIFGEANVVDFNSKTCMMRAFGNVDKSQSESTTRLKQKVKDIYRWKVEVEQACKFITAEVEQLELDRQRLKGASRVLMLPERISQECLELRSKRYPPDLVSDLAEQALKKEFSLVGEVRATLKATLEKLEEQMVINRAAKHRIESDWCDKTLAYDTDTLNLSLTPKSPNLLFRPGAVRFGDFSAPLEYWEYFCRENIKNSEEARQRSLDVRSNINSILINGGRKLRNQADKTDMAIAETVAMQTELCTKLEERLKEVLQKIADMETLINEIQDAIKKMDAAMKLAQTRLDNRNVWRHHGESVRDTPHLSLLQEVKVIHESVTSLFMQLKHVEKTRNELLDKRRTLEKDIASKRMTLNIDRDRLGMIRSHYPSASELAGF